MPLSEAEEVELLTLLEVEEANRMRWVPRDYQLPLWDYLHDGGLRADVAAHRRWGKDDVALNWAFEAAQNRVGAYWHMLPEAAQARKAIWDAVNPHTGKKRIDEAFPIEHRKSTRNTDMYIELLNGSTWQVVGSDNYDRLVGSSVAGIVFSEWSLAKPSAWTYLRPILVESGGWALFIWTPRGRNHATTAFEARALDKANWFTQRSPATDTGVFTADQLEREKAELIAESGSKEEGEAAYASEYLVDFDATAPGAYYAGLIREAELAGRLTRVPYDPTIRVDTSWDLGIDDYTAIWFFQQIGREIRAIDYFETSGEGLPAIVKQAFAAKPYIWGAHHLPHDVMVRELNTGRSRYDTLMSLGLTNIAVGKAMDPEERINASRGIIPLMWFDTENCALGLNRLRGYRKRWNRQTLSYAGPIHDKNSHGADAFGEFALMRRGIQAAKAPPKSNHHGGPLSWLG